VITPRAPVHPLGELAEALETTALACPGVVGLSGGRFGEVATYLPGRRIRGVRVAGDQVELHLMVVPDVPVWQTADRVLAEVAALAAPRRVHVVVADVADPAEPEAGP
jgi:hypothetical protein